MAERRIILGQKFGRLTVLSLSHKKGYTRYFLCQCDCGKQTVVEKSALTTGKQISCGCARNERIRNLKRLPDGYSRLHKIFHKMKARCYNPRSNRYSRYGARGIKICDEWLSDVDNFCRWAIENGYADNLSIDRIDNDGDYCPENCRWATNIEQSNNTSCNIFVTFNGKTQTLAQWSRELNIPTSTLHNRIRVNGWSVERALTTPSRSRSVSN